VSLTENGKICFFISSASLIVAIFNRLAFVVSGKMFNVENYCCRAETSQWLFLFLPYSVQRCTLIHRKTV